MVRHATTVLAKQCTEMHMALAAPKFSPKFTWQTSWAIPACGGTAVASQPTSYNR